MPELPRTQVAATVLAAIVVVVLGVRWIAAQSPAGAGASGPAPVARAPGVALERPPAPDALVHVAGAVRRPGVYRLAGGARVRDAVRRAGGATSRGDADAINLAAKVVDGQQVVVPRRQAAGTTAAVAGAAGATPGVPAAPVSLGSATLEQLDTLDGVGPATAQKILAYRREHGFRTVDDLANVPGIGPKKLAALKGQVQP